MQAQNVDEYTLIRAELNGLKDCITHYVQMALGGAGVLIAAYAALQDGDLGLQRGIASAGAAFVVTLILDVVFYKFHSHNRYAGYCKLLARESYPWPDDREQIHMWEECVGALREASRARLWTAEWWRHRFKGVWKRPAESWAFPGRIFRVFAALVALFAVICAAEFMEIARDPAQADARQDMAAALAVLWAPIAALWLQSFFSLIFLTRTAYTVEAFAQAFALVRKPRLAAAARGTRGPEGYFGDPLPLAADESSVPLAEEATIQAG